MKRLLSATLGLLLAQLLMFGTTGASEKSLFPYPIATSDNPQAKDGANGNGFVFCDTNSGMLIYYFFRGGRPAHAVVPQPGICKAIGGAVSFPYQVRSGSVFCDANAGMLIYEFKDSFNVGRGGTDFIVVPAPNICH